MFADEKRLQDVDITTIQTLSYDKNSSQSSSSTSDISQVEKQVEPWDGYESEDLPSKTQPHLVRNLRHQIFDMYRRLFGVVFIVNAAVLITVIVQNKANSQYLGLILTANLFVSIVMRQEHVVNMFFIVFTSVPSSWPLFIRRVCARVHHLGGIHSGCAVSGVMWLILFTIQATRELVNKSGISAATVGVSYAILGLLVAIIALSYPALRIRYHDTFEATHRFLGWTATGLFWCLVVLLVNDHRSVDRTLGNALLHAPPFWLVLLLTCSIIFPWLKLRKLAVKSEVLSEHCVRLYFDYSTPHPGQTIRLSDSPLTEWHSFATIPVPAVKEFSVVISRAGDWTSKVIDHPPKHIWVRGVPCYGALTVTKLFRKVVLVATGSGIGPCAPWVFEKEVPIKLLWTAPNLQQTFGDKLVDSVLEAAPDALIYDTRIHGRPDMVKLIYKLVKETEAEAVCIISNQPLTQKVVYGMMSRGIPAFGAIWDS
ncbi:hypothetical protein C8Q75DRAFT_807918 [Abortiporus biennis]|nr:hypothetical protein C8Q75DRAFT_807918 [Abortiporus biennis]